MSSRWGIEMTGGGVVSRIATSRKETPRRAFQLNQMVVAKNELSYNRLGRRCNAPLTSSSGCVSLFANIQRRAAKEEQESLEI